MNWIYLLIAGILEIGFAVTLKLTLDQKNSPLNILFFICLFGSFYFLQKSLSTIPIGTAYGIWTGIGAVGVAVIGIIYFKDPMIIGRLLFLSLLIISIIGLKLTSNL